MAELQSPTAIVYGSWMDIAEQIGGRDKQNELIMAAIRYEFYGELPDFKPGTQEHVFFSMAQPLIDADRRKRKGGAPKGNQNAQKSSGTKKQPKKTTSKQHIESTHCFDPLIQPQKQWSKQTTYTDTITEYPYTDTPSDISPSVDGESQTKKRTKKTDDEPGCNRQYRCTFDDME